MNQDSQSTSYEVTVTGKTYLDRKEQSDTEKNSFVIKSLVVVVLLFVFVFIFAVFFAQSFNVWGIGGGVINSQYRIDSLSDNDNYNMPTIKSQLTVKAQRL